MEELLLLALLTGEELNVVEQQRGDRAVITLKFINGVVLQRLYHIADETFRMQIDNLCIGFALQHHITHGVHEMGFPQSHSTVDEERIVSGTRIFRDLQRGGARRRADFQRHLCLAVPVDRTDDLTDMRQKAIMDPVEHETVGGEQTQGIAFLYRLQWPYPRVELLWRQFALEVCDAFLPQRAIHASFSHPLTWHSVDLHKREESILLAWSYPHPARDPRY